MELATSRQLVLDLKAKLQKTNEAVQLTKEIAEAEKQVSYLLDVEEMQIRLAEELFEVCEDYYSVTWAEALNLAGVPGDSKLRRSKKVYFHLEIHEIPVALLPSFVNAIEALEQPPAYPGYFHPPRGRERTQLSW